MRSLFFNLVGISITVSIIIVVLLLLNSYLNERYSVKWRYFIWLILAVRLVIPIDFGLTAPPVELKFNDHAIAFGSEATGRSPVELNKPAAKLPGSSDQGMKADAGEPGAMAGAVVASAHTDTADRMAIQGTASSGQTVSGLVTWIYLAGVAVFLLRQFILYLSFRRSTRRWYRNLSDPEIGKAFDQLRFEMMIDRDFQIKVCRKVSSPMILGLFHPMLLLPHEEYQREDLEVILKHELIHFRRNDLWFKLLLILANALHWFNPFIYIMVRQASRDIEISCDEEVLKGAGMSLRKRYSEQILGLMEGNSRLDAPVSTGFHGGKGMMKNRLRNIFDERIKKKGVLLFLVILSAVVVFSACRFDIGQYQMKIDPSSIYKARDHSASANIGLNFDLDHDGVNETRFTLSVADEDKPSYLTYQGKNGKQVRKEILKGVVQGPEYGLQAANLEDEHSIMLLVSVDYRGMPFGSGYWEMYSWDGNRFEEVDLKPLEERLQMRILEQEEIANNALGTGGYAYGYDASKYPAGYPAVGLYFKDDQKTGAGTTSAVYLEPMSEYDVEGFRTWGQDAVNKTMTKMELVSKSIMEGRGDPPLAFLETTEVVFITLPNVTATVTQDYQYRDGGWIHVDGKIE